MVFYVKNADCTTLIGFLYYNSLFARRPFNALISTFCQYPCMMKKQSLSLFFINSLSKLEISKESTSLHNNSKGSI